jgi:hypothetical protein
MGAWYCIVDNQQYGPVTEEAMRSWVQAGRVKAGDYVWTEGMVQWRPAGEVPGLFVAPSAPPAPQVPPGTQFPPAPAPGPYAPPVGGGYVRPHRGTTILVLGILSLACSCFILGIVAWVMGSNDLAEMAAGRMNRAGQGTTRAGKICGIISVVLTLAGFIMWILAAMFLPAVGHHHWRGLGPI